MRPFFFTTRPQYNVDEAIRQLSSRVQQLEYKLSTLEEFIQPDGFWPPVTRASLHDVIRMLLDHLGLKLTHNVQLPKMKLEVVPRNEKGV